MFLRTQNLSKISKPFWRLHLGRDSVVRPPSNGKVFRDIQHNMNMVLDLGFHIWFIMALYCKMQQTLLQNATAILLQNASGFLWQNARVLLQNAIVITNFEDLITKRDIYYKMQRLLQIVTVHNSYHCYGNFQSNKILL